MKKLLKWELESKSSLSITHLQLFIAWPVLVKLAAGVVWIQEMERLW